MIRVHEEHHAAVEFAWRCDAIRHIETRAADIWDALIDPNFEPIRFPGLDWDGDQATLWSESPRISHSWRIDDGAAAGDDPAGAIERRARMANLFAIFWLAPGFASCSSHPCR